MSGKRARKLRTHERARQDQTLAEAREMANEHTATFVTGYPDGEVQCCWCDCPHPVDDPTSPHVSPGYSCDGCPHLAVWVLHVNLPSTRNSYPACERHWPDLQRVTFKLVKMASRPQARFESHVRPITDEDVADDIGGSS